MESQKEKSPNKIGDNNNNSSSSNNNYFTGKDGEDHEMVKDVRRLT